MGGQDKQNRTLNRDRRPDGGMRVVAHQRYVLEAELEQVADLRIQTQLGQRLAPSCYVSPPQGRDDTSQRGRRRRRQRRLVFFVTGNPGLIGYYHEFLALVAEGVPECWVYGASLAGFGVRYGEDGRRKRVLEATETERRGQAPYGLKEEERYVLEVY